MNMRSTRSTVTFSNTFTLPGYPGELAAGAYDVLVEEELLQGLSFEAYRRTAIYLTVPAWGAGPGRSETRLVSEIDLKVALVRGIASIRNRPESQATYFPQEDMK